MRTLSPPFVSGGSSGGASLSAEPFIVASTPTSLTNSTLLSTAIQLGVYASIPLASAVPAGSLYFATDTFVIWRSTGAAWVSAFSLDREVFEDLVAALIADNSDLDWTYTDNGSSAGSLVAVIKPGAVTNAMIASAAGIPYSKLTLTGTVVNADVSASAAIAYSKLALTGAVLNADLAGSIAYSKLALTGAILNADLAGSIAYSKLSLTGAILNADLAGSIAYSKLSLTGTLVNADIANAAAIAYSKLALTGSIVNADVSASAAIAYSKLSLALSIATGDLVANAVTNAKLAQMAQSTIKGAIAGGGTTNPVDLTPAQVRAIIGVSMLGSQGVGTAVTTATTPSIGTGGSLLNSTVATPVCGVGDELLIDAAGTMTQTSGATAVVTWGIKLGATAVTVGISLTSGGTARQWRLRARCILTATNAQAWAIDLQTGLLAGTTSGSIGDTTVTSAIDLTAASTIDVTCQSATNTATQSCVINSLSVSRKSAA